MKRYFPVVAIVVFVAALLFSFLQWLFAPHHVERFELKVLQVQPSTNGSIQVTLLLTNGANARLNVIDDTFGRPFIAYETGDGIRHGITPLANMRTINLAPGECLTNTVTLSNAPAKFRLSCELSDTIAEMRVTSVCLFMTKSSAQRFIQARMKQMDIPPTTTEWIELKSFTNQPVWIP